MSEHYFSLLWVLRCLLQTRCELGLIVVVIKTSKNLGTMKSSLSCRPLFLSKLPFAQKPNEKKVLYVFG